MRVLHVIDSLGAGGAQGIMVRLIGELSRDHPDVENVVCAIESFDADTRLMGLLHRDGIEVEFVRHGPAPIWDLRPTLALRAQLRRHRIDLVHAHLYVASVHSRLAAASMRIPHITTLHTSPGEAITDTRAWLAADWLTARLSARLVAPSPSLATAAAQHLRVGDQRVAVIPNAPGVPATAPHAGGPTGVPTIVCVARLAPYKGQADLIEAVAGETLAGVRLVLVGDGPELPRLRSLVEGRGLGGRVSFLGHRHDVAELLAAADVFCLSSHAEALPLGLLEAMAAGLPCVCTAVGGIPDVLVEGTGLLVPPQDTGALRDALARVLGDRDLAHGLGERARERVAAEYSIGAVAARYVELYERVLSRRTVRDRLSAKRQAASRR